MRHIHLPGRSTVHGSHGVAATSHPLATGAAIEILRRGGNAIDAAIAASAVLSVVEPMSTGIGGDCFALYAPGGGPDVIGLNASGRAPRALSASYLLGEGINKIEQESPHSVTIPGAVDGWSRLMEDHGTLGLDAVLQPAIHFALEGFSVSPVVNLYWNNLLELIGRTESGVEHLTVNGRAPRVGEIFKSPMLGGTLQQIAKHGRDGFYAGSVAEDLVAHLQELGGTHDLDDFAATSCDYVTPIRAQYGDYDVLEIPPNGQGITALVMLNVLQHFDLASLDPHGAERLHLEMEAQRLAYELRDRFVADPEIVDVPVNSLLSRDLAGRLAKRISRDKKLEDVGDVAADVDRDTIYLTVIDRDLNSVSFINSLYMGFGSGFVGPKSGVTLQNRGCGFEVDPDHPNCVAGGKRPMHTIIPGMMAHRSGTHAGRVAAAFGVMGGDYQPTGHTHVVTNMIDYGMDPQEALDAPRSFFSGGKILVEHGVPSEVRRDLATKGHVVEEALMPWGGGQIARIDWQEGSLSAGSDHRKDGCAMVI